MTTEPHDLQPGVPCRVPGCPGPSARTADPGGLDTVRGWLANPNWPEFGPGIGRGPLDPGRVAARGAVEQVLVALAPEAAP
jgi:hypothetical protein